MAKKRKTLPDDFQEILDSGDMEAFCAVFDRCLISAVKRGRTTENALSFRNLTPQHITFLAENGLDMNADAGWGLPPLAHQAYSLDNLHCLLEHGARLDDAADRKKGNALFHAAGLHRAQDVRNLLACGASPDARGGWYGLTALDASLSSCSNADIRNMAEIAALLLDAGASCSDRTADYVREIGERFEFIRPDFNRDYVEEFSDALDRLYDLFDVEPVPRRMVYDGKSPIRVTAVTWQEQHEELWNMLVPGKGHAGTVQGELIRISGRITHEILDNGGMNWDSDFRSMARAMADYFHMASGMEKALMEEACSLSRSISSRTDKQTLYRLTELCIGWVLANPEPIPLPEPAYKR